MASKARELANLGNAYSDGALSNRNLIINGAMQVAQRGTSFAYNSFGGAGFCVDRFWFYNAGGATSGTVEQSTDVPSGEGFAYSLFNNTNAAMPSGTNVELTKQGNAAPFVVGNTYTLSFWVKGASASTGNTMQIKWRNSHANGTNAVQAVAVYPTFDITTSWARVVIPFTLSVSPVSANNVLDFEYSHPAGAKITGVQLEVGDTATPFEHRSYGQELALCQRYFWRSTGANYFAIGSGQQHSATQSRAFIPNPVYMRSAPTISISGTLRGNSGGSTVDVTTINDSWSGLKSNMVQFTTSGFSTGNGFIIHHNNNSSNYLQADAEL